MYLPQYHYTLNLSKGGLDTIIQYQVYQGGLDTTIQYQVYQGGLDTTIQYQVYQGGLDATIQYQVYQCLDGRYVTFSGYSSFLCQ